MFLCPRKLLRKLRGFFIASSKQTLPNNSSSRRSFRAARPGRQSKSKMKYFLDTEFIEDGKTIDLVSIAIVCEDGRKLYFEVDGVDWSKASEWVLENVKPHLWSKAKDKASYNSWIFNGLHVGGLRPREWIASDIVKFCDPEQYGKPEFWGYYADYDWVVLCQLFGRMIDLPKGWPMYCNDLKQLVSSVGNAKLPKQEAAEHHALADAEWIADTYGKINSAIDYLASQDIAPSEIAGAIQAQLDGK